MGDNRTFKPRNCLRVVTRSRLDFCALCNVTWSDKVYIFLQQWRNTSIVSFIWPLNWLKSTTPLLNSCSYVLNIMSPKEGVSNTHLRYFWTCFPRWSKLQDRMIWNYLRFLCSRNLNLDWIALSFRFPVPVKSSRRTRDQLRLFKSIW